MRQAYRIISVYTGDLSGACSALYELGGMTVMHDPSGCNSTYNTHDEIRWYDQDSLIYISGLNDLDAVMGNDDKLIEDITVAAEQTNPRFIALANSPIPYLNGTDFEGIARVLEADTGLPVFYIPTNGMHDYVRGGGLALERLAEKLLKRDQKNREERKGAEEENEGGKIRVSVLGMTPLDFAAASSVSSVRRILKEAGMEVTSCWAMGDSLDDLLRAPDADVNLVVSSLGMRAAVYLKETFGIPSVFGLPAEGIRQEVLCDLKRAAEDKKDRFPCRDLRGKQQEGEKVLLIGEPVTMGSLAAVLEKKRDCSVRLVCPTEDCEAFMAEGDMLTRGEEEVEKAFRAGEYVIADPLYQPIVPASCPFVPLPHLAFSGRIFLKDMPDLFGDLSGILPVTGR
jgi:nitrogenase molybdenum-iron protein alpha/beta subunit